MTTTDLESQAGTEASELAGQIEKIVAQIKKAVLALDKDAPANGGRITITEADLTLEAVLTKDVGGDFKFKIFGHDLGGGTKLTKADTQTIEVKLKPRAADAMAFGDDEIATKLLAAMRAIRDGVSHAASDEPRFVLEEGSVELNFEVDKDGNLDFIVAGERKSANTQTVKLTLGSA